MNNFIWNLKKKLGEKKLRQIKVDKKSFRKGKDKIHLVKRIEKSDQLFLFSYNIDAIVFIDFKLKQQFTSVIIAFLKKFFLQLSSVQNENKQ